MTSPTVKTSPHSSFWDFTFWTFLSLSFDDPHHKAWETSLHFPVNGLGAQEKPRTNTAGPWSIVERRRSWDEAVRRKVRMYRTRGPESDRISTVRRRHRDAGSNPG